MQRFKRNFGANAPDELKNLSPTEIEIDGEPVLPEAEPETPEETETPETSEEPETPEVESEAPEEPETPEEEPEEEEPEEEPISKEDAEVTLIDIEQQLAAQVEEKTNGKYKSVDEALQRLSEIEDLLSDEYIEAAVKHYKNEGTLEPFLEATTKDFDKMGDVDLMRYKFNKENEGMNPKIMDRLFREEVLSKYNLDDSPEYTEDDLELGKAKLMRDAGKIRQELISNQEKFKKPPTLERGEPSKPEGPTPEEEALLAESVKNSIAAHLKKGKTDKESVFSVKVSDKVSYNMGFTESDQAKAVDFALDTGKVLQSFVDEKGKPDYLKWIDMVKFVSNPEAYRKELYDTGQSAGREALEAELAGDEPKPKETPSRKEGETGNFALDLLKAAQKQVHERRAAGLEA